MNDMTPTWTVLESPVGLLRVVAAGGAVSAIQFHPFAEAAPALVGAVRDDATPVLVEAVRQLRAYFAGELREFELPLAAVGTAYQHRVWDVLGGIGHGSTATYAEVARRLGQPLGASRAVGVACGRNPIPIVVPCHRIVGTDGTLTGYAGGLERKRLLLELEQAPAVCAQAPLF